MAQPEEIQVVVELTHHTLHALRAVNGTIEAGGECMLDNKASVEALLTTVAPSWATAGTRAAASVWPEGVAWHISDDTETMLDRSGEALRIIAARIQDDTRGALAYAACGAGDGSPVTPEGMDKWVLASTVQEALAKVLGKVAELKVESDGFEPAAFARAAAILGALRRAGTGDVVLWDLGTAHSYLVLITANGIERAVPCDVGLDSIFEAVQAALRLKFRGAGERLFFNETYDFTEAGPKVGAAVAAKFKPALDQLAHTGGPLGLSCVGLTGKQGWFLKELAAAVGAVTWNAEAAKLAADMGLKFSDGSVEAAFSTASAGIFEVLASRLKATPAWHPAWISVEAMPPEMKTPSRPPIPEPVAEPAPPPAAAAPKPSTRQAPPAPQFKATMSAPAPEAGAPPLPPFPQKTAKPMPPPPAPGPPQPFPMPGPAGATARAPAPAAAPAPEPVSADPFPMPGAPAAAPFPSAPLPSPPLPSPPSFGLRQAPPPPPDSRPPSFSRPPPFEPPEPNAPPGGFSNPPLPVPPSVGVKLGAVPPPPVTALPFEGAKLKRPVPVAKDAPPEPEPEPRSKLTLFIWIGVAAAVLFAVFAIILDAHMERIKAMDIAQQEELAHHIAEQRLKEAEESAKAEADESKKELDTAIEITRKQTQDETRREVLAELEAEQRAKMPGTILVATQPAGASVSIDGARPLVSPAKADGIAPGQHRIQISLAGYDPVELTADLKGSQTTDLGTIALQTIYGSMDVSSYPSGLEFSVRAGANPMGMPLLTGRTPASFEGVVPGDYVITFVRPGCNDHVEKVTVVKGRRAPAATHYLDGALDLSSDPGGAWVEKDGIRLGTTPLVIHDLTPRRARFELTLPGYDPTPLTCDIPEGKTLKLDVALLRRDRVFNASEVKTLPVSFESPPPALSEAQAKSGAEVLLSFIVRLDGSVSDVVVEKASDDDVGRRCKAAVERWRFRPATAPDDRIVDMKMEMPFKFPANP